MNINEIVEEKRLGQTLTKEEVDFFVYGITSGKISSDKIVSFLSIINEKNFNYEETYWLADAMARSGKMLNISSEVGDCVDKHSAGLISDASTLVFMSVLAALSVKAVKGISSDYGDFRNSLQRLSYFKGFNPKIEKDKLVKILNDVGAGVFDETGVMAPADIITYKLRKKFQIVSAPLVAASILSKKIATGASIVVYDVKTGEGAISSEPGFSQTLAEYLVNASKLANIKAAAVVSDLNQPLSSAIGSQDEIKEVIDVLKTKEDKFDSGLLLVARELVVMALILSGKAGGRTEAAELFDDAITSGRALEKFKTFIETYGGNWDLLSYSDSSVLSGKAVSYVTAEDKGYISNIDLTKLTRAYNILFEGCKREQLDRDAGIELLKREGNKVNKGDKIVRIHYNLNNIKFSQARREILDAFVISKTKPTANKILYKVVV